jgi:hypothetical protein
MGCPATFKFARPIASSVFKIEYNLELVPDDSVWQRSEILAAANLTPISAMRDNI